MTDDIESFSNMLRKALGARLNHEASSFPDMMAQDGVMKCRNSSKVPEPFL